LIAKGTLHPKPAGQALLARALETSIAANSPSELGANLIRDPVAIQHSFSDNGSTDFYLQQKSSDRTLAECQIGA
jgi:hypothetical protein